MSKSNNIRDQPSKKQLTIEEEYKYYETQREHILEVPDTYLGSIKTDRIMINTYNNVENIIKCENKIINAGLYKIFDEILVNASDNSINHSDCDTIRINVNNDGFIEVYNNGEAIKTGMHKDLNMRAPQMIFSRLLTSGNYRKTGKIVGGKNGYGAKLTNIFSKYFEVEIVNVDEKVKYTQIFRNNMSVIEEPIIEKLNKNKNNVSYTKIRFLPDYERFKMSEGLTEDMKLLFKKRAYDIAGTSGKHMNIYFNDELLNMETFEDYIKKYYTELPPLVYQKFNDRWEVGVLFEPSKEHNHISFVNRISTKDGGTHVKYIMDQIVEKVTLKNKNKKITIKPSNIKDNLTLFINCVIEDPDFGSQSKDMLTTKVSEFNVKCEIDDKFITKLCKTGLMDEIVKTLEAKQIVELDKGVVKKRDDLNDIIKLVDANDAGKKRKKPCYLILTEGDSAKTLVMNGMNYLDRNSFGVYPLKGKPLNPREATQKQLVENEELIHLKRILKLTKDTDDILQCRYDGIIILSDADDDGIHIKGLIINLFHKFWKQLISKGFIYTALTPIYKATKKAKKNKEELSFYNKIDYDNWVKNNADKVNSYTVKYFKGLGTYTKDDAKIIFDDFENKLIKFTTGKDILTISEEEIKNYIDKKKKTKKIVDDENDDNEEDNTEDNKSVQSIQVDNITNTDKSILLAFAKQFADDRKRWLDNYNNLESNIVDNELQVSDFINRDLIRFSMADNNRSIPNLYDGLKPSQRKILYASFKRNLKDEIKVSQFAGYVSEHTEYHHGEASLYAAIIQMAQNFWCSNNINLLSPDGQFGSRLCGGKDSSSPRYIYTKLTEITRYIFSVEDEPILEYIVEEGNKVEPITYYPIIPMILVNGTKGIGTGYSTNIPSFNPLDIIENLKLLLKNKKMKKMDPWIRDFKGTIKEIGTNKYETQGIADVVNENTVVITELPAYCWTDDYKIKLFNLTKNEDVKQNILLSYPDNNTDTKVHYTLNFIEGELQKIEKENNDNNNELIKKLKLTSKINLTNMHVYKNNLIIKYHSPLDIITDYSIKRLEIYELRRQYKIKILTNELEIIKYTIKYINQVLNKEIIVERRRKAEIIEDVINNNYPKLSKKETIEPSYDYLTGLLLFSITQDTIDELNKKYDEINGELNYYKNTTNKELWLKELTDLETYYNNTFLQQFVEEEIKTKSKPKTKKSKK